MSLSANLRNDLFRQQPQCTVDDTIKQRTRFHLPACLPRRLTFMFQLTTQTQIARQSRFDLHEVQKSF
jgi:hypothetical protein